MLSFPQTKVFQSIERAVAAGFTIDQEGKALTWTSVSGVSGVRKSAGTGTEVFAGVALNMLYLPVEVPFSERLTQASLAITLSNTPLGGTLRVYNVTTATVFTAGNGTDANTYSLSGVTATLPVAMREPDKEPMHVPYVIDKLSGINEVLMGMRLSDMAYPEVIRVPDTWSYLVVIGPVSDTSLTWMGVLGWVRRAATVAGIAFLLDRLLRKVSGQGAVELLFSLFR
jgi:hypothetical protein